VSHSGPACGNLILQLADSIQAQSQVKIFEKVTITGTS
jgi:hypothetical protein